MSEYFPEPKSLVKVKIELDLSNYAIKTDSKNATGIDMSSFAEKLDLASLKSKVGKLEIYKLKNVPTNLRNLKQIRQINKVSKLLSKVDKLDVDNLLPVPVHLSKLSDVVKNDIKKDVYNAKITNIEDKIPDTTNVATKTTLNPHMHEIFLQLSCMKWVPGNPKIEILN